MLNARITRDFSFHLHFTMYLTKRKAHRIKITGFFCNLRALHHCISTSAGSKGEITTMGQTNDYGGRQRMSTEPQNVGQGLSVPPSKSGNYECNRSSLSNSLNWENNLKAHTVTCVFSQMTGAEWKVEEKKVYTNFAVIIQSHDFSTFLKIFHSNLQPPHVNSVNILSLMYLCWTIICRKRTQVMLLYTVPSTQSQINHHKLIWHCYIFPLNFF